MSVDLSFDKVDMIPKVDLTFLLHGLMYPTYCNLNRQVDRIIMLTIKLTNKIFNFSKDINSTVR